MFKSARIKLTLWYLLILMTISLGFSLSIFKLITNEIDRFVIAQRTRIQRRFNENNFPPPPILEPEFVSEIENHVAVILITLNGFILITSGGLAYFLAGKTLAPIQEMVDEQNRFISDASHEFRTPLTSLKSSIEVFLRDKKPSLLEAKELMKDSLYEVNRLEKLSSSLLELAQYQEPKENLRLTPLHLSKL